MLVHGGWSKGKALPYDFLPAATFLLGGLVAYALSSAVDVSSAAANALNTGVFLLGTALGARVQRERQRS